MSIQDDNRNLNTQAEILRRIKSTIRNIESIRSDSAKELSNQLQTIRQLQSEQQKVNELERDRVTSIERFRVESDNKLRNLKQELDLVKNSFDASAELLKLTTDTNQEIRDRAKLLADELEIDADKLKLIEEIVKQQQLLLDLETKRNNALKVANDNIESFGKFLGLASTIQDTWLGRFERTLSASLEVGTSIKGYASSILNANMAAKLFEKSVSLVARSTQEMFFAVDNIISGFNQATGAAGAYDDIIDKARLDSVGFGVGIKQAGDAINSLFSQFNNFQALSNDLQNETIKLTATLTNLGVSSSTTAENFDLMTKALNLNTQEAMVTQKELVKLAQVTGQLPETVSKSFANALPKLAGYGEQAVDIFKEMSAQAKATGISVEGLLGIVSQFDTFEGAADAAGRLNALLGGNLLNSTELLAATESERIDLLRESLQLVGANFSELGKYEQKSIAAAIGISDLAEANRLFATGQDIFDDMTAAISSTTLSQEDLRKASLAGTAVQEQFNLSMQNLSVLVLPLIQGFRALTDTFLSLHEASGNYLGPILVGATGTIYLLSKMITLWNLAMKISTMSTVSNSAAQMVNLEIVQTSSGAIQVNTVATNANTAANNANTTSIWSWIKGIAVSIGTLLKRIAVGALYYAQIIAITTASFAAAVAQTTWESIRRLSIGTTIASTAALIANTAVTWLATAATTAFGIALAIATSPVTLIIGAIALLVAAIIGIIFYWKELTSTIVSAVSSLFDLSDGFLVLMGPIGWMIMAGKQIYNNWSGIADMFSNIGTNIVNSFSNIIGAIRSVINSGSSLFNGLISGLNYIPGFNIPTIPMLAKGTDRFEGGTALVGEEGPELVNMPSKSSVITNENVQKLEGIIKQTDGTTSSNGETAKKVSNHLASNQNQNNFVTRDELMNLFSNMTKEVVLKVDERQLGRVMVDLLDRELRLNSVSN